MQMYLTNDIPSTASEHDDQASREQYLMIQMEYHVLSQNYQTLYDHFHALLERAPLCQGEDQDRDKAAYRHAMQEYCQSLHEQISAMQHFRHALRSHLVRTKSVRKSLNRNTPAQRSCMRKTILLGMGNAQAAAVLLERMHHTGAHRVFVAADWSEVVRIVHNVHLDVLVLDDELIPFPAMQLSHQLRGMQGLEILPIILLSASFSMLHQEEHVSPNLIGLEKPITGEALIEAIDQLAARKAAPVGSSSCTLERQTDARSVRGMSERLPAFV